MIPDGWKEAVLNDAARVIDCKHRTPSYVDDGIPLVSPGTIKWGGLDLVTPTKHVTFEEYEALMDHCKVERGDLVLSRNQSVGIASYVDSDSPFVLGQDTVLIKPVKVDKMFLFYFLQSDFVQRSIYKMAGGSTFSRINLGDIRKLRLVFPELHHQKKIAKILSTWDKAIETVEKLIENSQQKKKALMQQLLTGKKRFPGFDGEWKEVHVGDFLIESRVPSTSNDPSKRLTVKLHLKGIEHRECRGTESVDSTAHFVRSSGQFIYGKQNIHKGALGIVQKQFDGFETSQDIPAFDFKEGCVPMWLYYFFAQENFYAGLEALMTGTGSKRLSPKDFLRIKLKAPNEREQQKIASALIVAENEVRSMGLQLALLKQEKKALMQQLLTGKRRVQVN